MTSQSSLNLDSYFREISSAMICKSSVKKAFLAELKDRINEFVEENRLASTADIAAHFGQPAEIAQAFLETTEPSQLKKAMNWKKVVLIGVVAALLIWAGVALAGLANSHYNARGFVSDYGVVDETPQTGG